MFGLKKTLNGGDPRAHRQETGGTLGGYPTRQIGLAHGLIAGTRIATAIGWRDVEAITKGDLVLTFDRGMQPVRKITRGILWSTQENCPKALWPLKVPAGALGNLEDITLVPEQQVLVESDTADLLFGDPFSLIRIGDLDGYRGIERTPPLSEIEIIQLHFDEDEVVFAGSGALTFCPSLKVIDLSEILAQPTSLAVYSMLDREEAAMLVDCLKDEDQVSVPVTWPVSNTMLAASAG